MCNTKITHLRAMQSTITKTKRHTINIPTKWLQSPIWDQEIQVIFQLHDNNEPKTKVAQKSTTKMYLKSVLCQWNENYVRSAEDGDQTHHLFVSKKWKKIDGKSIWSYLKCSPHCLVDGDMSGHTWSNAKNKINNWCGRFARSISLHLPHPTNGIQKCGTRKITKIIA